MKKYFILATFLCLALKAQAEDFNNPSQSFTRSRPGENWIMLSRGAFTTATTALTISKPGNYMVTESFAVPSSAGGTNIISITASDVVLDFGGHTIDGASEGGIGVLVGNSLNNITIRNGSIRDNDGICIKLGTSNNNIHIETIR